MIVSQFSIGNNAYLDKLAHYRLLLTNLAGTSYRFRLSLRVREPDVHLSSRYIVKGHSLYASGTFLPPINHRYRGERTIRVQSHDTVSIHLMPFDVANWASPSSSMELFGYVELTIPVEVVDYAGNVAAQGDEPVPVLLYAYQVDSDNTQGFHDTAEVSIATGRAENEIKPDKPFNKDLVAQDSAELGIAFKKELEAAHERGMVDDLAARLEDPRTMALVLAYLGHYGDEPRSLGAINQALEDAGHAVRLEED